MLPLLCHCASNFCERFEFKLVILYGKKIIRRKLGALSLSAKYILTAYLFYIMIYGVCCADDYHQYDMRRSAAAMVWV